MEKSLFIVTKPLQYLNAINIEDHSSYKICTMCNQFKDAYDFFEICKEYGPFHEYHFKKNKNVAIVYWIFHQLRINYIYIDSDYGFLKRFLLLFFFKKKIYVYEEGYASYTPLRQPNTLKNRFCLFIANLFDIKNYSGGSSHVNGIYLYNPNAFITVFGQVNKELRNFKLSFEDNILRSKELEIQSKDIDFSFFNDSDVVIYLSSWTISEEAIRYCDNKRANHLCVLKLHPHIKMNTEDIMMHFDITMPNNLMFEYIYYKIYSLARGIEIVHHGTYAVNFIDFHNSHKVKEVVFHS